ncbi:MAG: hypothetical protein LBT38_02325, partial [Deltaproteobacteria bacterium]|nr:hypothetical protein [Deltaproteobacteria bacterium]
MTNERIKTDNNKLLDNKIITFSKNSKLSSENVELQILGVLESLLSRSTKDDADALINWTLKSAREISTDLSKFGHQVSHHRVGKMLRRLGYNLQVNV